MFIEKINALQPTPIQPISSINNNQIFIKREDLLFFSFGGNKLRKAQLFFEEIDKGSYDCVVTYGSSSSNHCRVVANMATARELPCYIISPKESSKETYNSKLMQLFGTEITICPVDEVHNTIENKLQTLSEQGFNPYFIAGGGHGNIGTQAYVECYDEIKHYEKENNIHFDYIFHASGTGTTQAGLVCGLLINNDNHKIIGISIARKNPYGRDVIIKSIKDYLKQKNICVANNIIEDKTIFIDDYIYDGYASFSLDIEKTIKEILIKYGIPLDPTYTGKAFNGMTKYIDINNITNKNILFIHTGGTPLFFDYLK